MTETALLSLGIVALVCVATAVTGITRRPGTGIILALIIISLALWNRPNGFTQLGFTPPGSWTMLVLVGAVLGIGISLFTIMLLEPLVEKFTGVAHDISVIDPVRGNLFGLIQVILMIWVLVAIVEELVFRGFLITELVRVFGTSHLALTIILLFTSIVFGLSHWYQGPSGAISTGIVGLVLALIFALAEFNLWLPILVHGFIDTFSLILIYKNWDKTLKRVFIKPKGHKEAKANIPE